MAMRETLEALNSLGEWGTKEPGGWEFLGIRSVEV